MANILVVDDELGIRDLLSEILFDEGHQVELPDLVLLDIWMPDTDGVSLLKEWATSGLLNMPVIMMSGHATIDTAVDAVKIGAHAFLEKPITLQKLLTAVEQGLARDQVKQAVVAASVSLSTVSTSVVTHGEVISAVLAVQQTFDLDRPLREARDAFEKAYFEFHLAHEAGSMTKVAEKTGLERTHLYRKLKQLGVDLSRSKRPI
jgi:DNA-binding NtrC family response regulator